MIAAVLSIAVLCSCSKKEKDGVYKFLGDYSYSDPAVCMVYEPVEGETDESGNLFYGIQYRVITDLDGLLASGETVLIYFYSSMSNSGAEMTAAVEDIAQLYNGKLTVIMMDAMEYRDMMDKYEIEAVPEFVIIKAGQQDSIFNNGEYDYWTVNDVLLWLQSNGIS